jgi:O-antigen biosynthesis protein WbqP
MKRAFDLILALFAMVVLFIPGLVIALCVRMTSAGPSIYWSQRVGKGGTLFNMPKFRTMQIDAPAVATHLMTDPQAYLTPIGGLLRKTSLDELPQLWCILRGDMSFVGPRPALFNQYDLMAMRSACGVTGLVPGLTGWAQINGRDELPLEIKVRYDEEYLKRRSFSFDLYIMWKTALKVMSRSGVSH